MAKQSIHKQEMANIQAPNEQALATLIRQEVQQYSGPLPHPDILKGYEEVLPGSAERILKMAEKEEDHRHQAENNIIRMESRDSLMGILFSFVLSLGFLGCGTAIILLAKSAGGTVAGGLFGVSGFAGVVTSIIKYTRSPHGDNNGE